MDSLVTEMRSWLVRSNSPARQKGFRFVFFFRGGALGLNNGSSVLLLYERSLEHIGGEAE